jgi:hypothetical protein
VTKALESGSVDIIKPHSGLETVTKALESKPTKSSTNIDKLEKMLKNPNGLDFPNDMKDGKSKVEYLENLKKQFEEAQGKIDKMVDSEKEK